MCCGIIFTTIVVYTTMEIFFQIVIGESFIGTLIESFTDGSGTSGSYEPLNYSDASYSEASDDRWYKENVLNKGSEKDESYQIYVDKMKDLEYRQPIDTSKIPERDAKWVENLRSRGYSDYDINKMDDNMPSGELCYIATACSQGMIPLENLIPLKFWRYSVLESSKIGMHLSNYYRKTAPAVAQRIGKMPKTCCLLRKVFILPSLTIVEKDKTFLRDISLKILFLVGLITAKLVTVFKN